MAAEVAADRLRDFTKRFPASFERAACTDIVRSIPHAVMLVDARQRVVLANRPAALLLGRTSARLRGASITELLPPEAITALLGDQSHGRVRVCETCLSSTGTPAVCTIKITATALNNRQALGFTLLVIEDISEKATLEQQLVDSETQAAMGQLAAGLLHEVANPVTSLGSNLLFVRGKVKDSVPADVMQALDASLDQLEHMRQLLGTLSSFPGRAKPRYELADMHQMIRQCLTFVAKDAERRNIAIVAPVAPRPAICEMDVRLIKQMLLNLLKNSMEAMPNGGRLAIYVSIAPVSGPPKTISVEVVDNGSGIAEADLRRVFRPLFSTKRHGAGLGLSFCRQTAEEHGGEICITSFGKDQGTSVCVTLPVLQDQNPDD